MDSAALAEDEVSAGTSAGCGSTSNCPACGSTNRRPGRVPCRNGGRNNFRVSAESGGMPERRRFTAGVGHFAGQSGLRHHAACQRGTVFKTRANSPRNPLLRHYAACQRGAVFTAIDGGWGRRSAKHRSTLASRVVAGVREVIPTRRLWRWIPSARVSAVPQILL